jgi:hypothetical protein
MTFDPTSDFASVIDGLESVTVSRRGSSAMTEVTHALRRTVRMHEAQQSQGQYTASDVIWHLPTSELPAAPRAGDVIIDGDGGRWTVLHVQKIIGDTRWRCVCRNLAVVQGLDAFVDVEKATYVKSPSGAEKPAWHAWKTGIRARIQPVQTQVRDEHQRQVAAAAFKVFLAEDVRVDHTHRIKGPDGIIYRVVGCRKAERIDALMEIDVVRVD